MDHEFHTLAFPNVVLLKNSNQLEAIITILRDAQTQQTEFVFYSHRLFRMLLEVALNALPFTTKTITTASGMTWRGKGFCEDGLCGVSVIRAGESMERAFRDVCHSAKIGKMLPLRDSKTFEARITYEELPSDIDSRWVFVLDPVITTGGSSLEVVKRLVERGVGERKIIFVTAFTSETGLQELSKRYPSIKIIAAVIDAKLNENMDMVPGCGNFGDRYYGTV